MNPALESALAGEPVTVTLEGKEYPLAYPMRAVILYKQETAKLDRARAEASGRAKLTRDEKRELQQRRTAILKTAPPKKSDDWTADDVEKMVSILSDSTAITCLLDEDAGTGDSLYEVRNWRKIGSDDFERLLLALWVGLHQSSNTAAPLTLDALGMMNLCDTQLDALVEAINKALSRSLIAPRSEEPDPNAPLPDLTTLPTQICE
jgi:hypothetical protein